MSTTAKVIWTVVVVAAIVIIYKMVTKPVVATNTIILPGSIANTPVQTSTGSGSTQSN